MVKDSGYYILILLFTVALTHLLYEQDEHTKWWQIVLILISIAGICCCRKDGSLVVIMTLVCGFVAYKKYRKIFWLGIASCISCTLLISGLYMKLENIPKGSVKEVLSIPMQQTARYVKEHYEEIAP